MSKNRRKDKPVKSTEILDILYQSLLIHYILVKCLPKITETWPVEGSIDQIVNVQVTLRLEDVTTGETLDTVGFGSAQGPVGKAIIKAMLDATKYAWLACIQKTRR